MTHDLMLSLIEGLQTRVEKIVIDDLRDNTFFAKIVLRHSGGSRRVDARPSDALALAVRAKAPIFVSAAVMRQAVALGLVPGAVTISRSAEFGLHLQRLTDELREFFGEPDGGVLVAAVTAGGPAAAAGLRRGDIVTEADGRPVEGPEELLETLGSAERKRSVVLTVVRDSGRLTIELKPAS
jgi:membrane-associated protease RseP (regulator of RpoE activity)